MKWDDLLKKWKIDNLQLISTILIFNQLLCLRKLIDNWFFYPKGGQKQKKVGKDNPS